MMSHIALPIIDVPTTPTVFPKKIKAHQLI